MIPRFWSREEGAIATELVIVLPLLLMIFFASFEAGYAMLRIVWLERSLDITIRDLRLGALGENPTHDEVRARLCRENILMASCNQELAIEMQVIDRVTWQGFTSPAVCVDRTTDIFPLVRFQQGTSNEVVTVRACAVFDPFFPSTSWGLNLRLDASGGYQIAARSAFVNEPRE